MPIADGGRNWFAVEKIRAVSDKGPANRILGQALSNVTAGINRAPSRRSRFLLLRPKARRKRIILQGDVLFEVLLAAEVARACNFLLPLDLRALEDGAGEVDVAHGYTCLHLP